ncbi:MAG: hypothetical protein AAF563_00055 [Pseudomonadota bacterium]
MTLFTRSIAASLATVLPGLFALSAHAHDAAGAPHWHFGDAVIEALPLIAAAIGLAALVAFVIKRGRDRR